MQSEEIIDRKPHLQMETTPLQNPISSGGGAEQIYDSSLKESNNHLSAFASNAAENQVAKQNATEVSEDLKFSLKHLLLLLLL